MKLVILESYVMEPGDLDWSGLRVLVPDVTEYIRTPYDQIARRIGGRRAGGAEQVPDG